MDGSGLTEVQFSRLLLLTALTLPLKAWAIWRAARNGSKAWFVGILLINTFGILELVYLFYFSKPKAPKTNHDV